MDHQANFKGAGEDEQAEHINSGGATASNLTETKRKYSVFKVIGWEIRAEKATGRSEELTLCVLQSNSRK